MQQQVIHLNLDGSSDSNLSGSDIINDNNGTDDRIILSNFAGKGAYIVQTGATSYNIQFFNLVPTLDSSFSSWLGSISNASGIEAIQASGGPLSPSSSGGLVQLNGFQTGDEGFGSLFEYRRSGSMLHLIMELAIMEYSVIWAVVTIR